MSAVASYRLSQARSLALHAAVAERLRREPELLERARRRVEDWLTDGTVHPCWAEAWREVLRRPIEDVLRALVDPSQLGHDLRQSSPFAGVLDPRTRWRILAATSTGSDPRAASR